METNYHHAEIKNNEDLIDKITNLENELSQKLNRKIVLIAYTE